ncbi:MAG: ABC transporter permease [Acidobacteria bacterium]|nr:ABC transporter permease [Acidobacteriota bacterium]
MRKSTLLKRNLTYFWRTNLAVALGVTTAVAVLAGALLVGESVRASLRDLFLQRLGAADYVISAPNFFREALADDLQTRVLFGEAFRAACPLIVLDGLVVHGENGRRASGVRVYGVDEKFFRFHGVKEALPSLASRGDGRFLHPAPSRGRASRLRSPRPAAAGFGAGRED